MLLIQQIQQQVSALVAQLPRPCDLSIVVAYSGGLDSHVLLHALASLKAEQQYSRLGPADFVLSAIHIHHGINLQADAWQQHCQKVCMALRVPFQSAKVNVNKQPRQSLEAVARQARYSKLVELAPPGSTIVLGQHVDDQLETVLLQLKRGAGPKGLSGMARLGVSKDNAAVGVSFFRPLLGSTQAQILAYAREFNLSWQEDDSNQDTNFERNFLRHNILPLLNDRWPQFAYSVARSAQLCAEQQLLLDEVCEQKLVALCGVDNSLDIAQLHLLSEAWRKQLVRTWLAQQQVQSPSQAILQQLIIQLANASDDANPLIQWQTWQCRRFRQRLYLLPLSEDLSGIRVDFAQAQEIQLPQQLGRLHVAAGDLEAKRAADTMTFVGLKEQVQVRFGGYGDKFKPLHSAHSKPLKQWLKLWNVPPWQRDKVAIIMHKNNILAVVLDGQLIPSQTYLVEPGQTLQLTYRPSLK
ncbi:MAG: tRNA(Ile)-lysidine synthase [Paraglaciecola sp.]|jgi:tRNA(Ile)-lysidine synthase